MDKYVNAANLIYKEQKKVVGNKLSDFIIKNIPEITLENGQITEIKGDNPKKTLDRLIKYYSQIFGQTSIEVSKDAIENIKAEFSPEELPKSLRE